MTNVPFGTFLAEQTPLVQLDPDDCTLRVNRAGAELLIKQLVAVRHSGEEETCVVYDGDASRPLVVAPGTVGELAVTG